MNWGDAIGDARGDAPRHADEHEQPCKADQLRPGYAEDNEPHKGSRPRPRHTVDEHGHPCRGSRARRRASRFLVVGDSVIGRIGCDDRLFKPIRGNLLLVAIRNRHAAFFQS